MSLTRRRFITISAAACGLPLLAPVASGAGPAADPTLRIWSGAALGADATLQINHPDPAAADRLIAAALTEVERLEGILSLYRPDSALSRLNRDGLLDEPPFDLVRLLSESRRFGELTGGAFDITVQPLWDLYARHFAVAGASPDGPAPQAIAAATARVGQSALTVGAERIQFDRPGMGLTLNGIGQGYVTDRIVEVLKRGGVDHALVDMGETRAIGSRPDGRSWTVGLEDPRSPGAIAERLAVVDRAVATSGGYGTVFDPSGRFNHIFEPGSGRTSWRWLSVSVEAATATEADALSTAFTLMPEAATAPIVHERGLTAHFVRPDGSRLVQRS